MLWYIMVPKVSENANPKKVPLLNTPNAMPLHSSLKQSLIKLDEKVVIGDCASPIMTRNRPNCKKFFTNGTNKRDRLERKHDMATTVTLFNTK